MFSRTRQIQLAILLPIGFLLARAIYAVLFGGARAGQILLFDLPEISLVGPFAHVSLFGSVYLDGLAANLSTALPFALFMLLTGLAVVLIKPSQLFAAARKLPAFRSLLSALAIGWVQIPALIQASRRIGRAIQLRRESKVRALLPILETAIGTALAIAQRLSLIESVKSGGGVRLQLKDVSIAEAGLAELNLSVGPGECLVVSGPTGSGKSSLLIAATGLAAELGLSTTGQVQTPSPLGFVSQQAREQLFGPLVHDEVETTSHFGLDAKLESPVHLLSEGEAIQVSLIRELQKQPKLLILDEPFAGLDDQACRELVSLLQEFLAGGGALLVAEHRPELLATITTCSLQILDGRLAPGSWSAEVVKAARKTALLPRDEIFRFEAESIGFDRKVLVGKPVITIRQSEVVAVTGANGVGKTSLLNAIEDSSKDFVLVPELVSDFFVTTTLEAELSRADRIAKVDGGFTRANLEAILGFLPDLETHPRDLSAGTQLALAIAMQMSHKPKILLIDEPTKGFDPQVKSQAIATLECVQETGCAVVFATHDRALIDQLATTVYEISNTELRQIGRVLA
jgi:energy-coupling factor transporter ATP-binding protein EcfA2